MAAYDLPDAFLPASARIWLEEAVLGATSPLTQDSQIRSLALHKWRMTIDYPPERTEDAAAREAFWNKVGSSNTVRVWHPRWPIPRGTMRGSPVLGVAAAKGASSLTLAGAFARNLLRYPQQRNNAVWVPTRASVTADAIVAPDGTTTADKLVEDSTAESTHNLIYNGGVAFVAGTTYTFSDHLKAGERSTARLSFQTAAFGSNIYAQFDLAAGTVLAKSSEIAASITAIGSGWYRCAITADATATATAGSSTWIGDPSATDVTYTGDGTSGLYLWGAQLEAGALTAYDAGGATLLAADCIGLGDQMVQVMEDAAADGSGVMTVSIIPKLRKAYALNTPIVWDRARVEMRVLSPIEHPYAPGYAPGITVDLREK